MEATGRKITRDPSYNPLTIWSSVLYQLHPKILASWTGVTGTLQYATKEVR